MSLCACQSDDAPVAVASVRRAPLVRDLIDESHRHVVLRRCPCGQAWLSVFTELIDWSGGDDSQAWMHVPLDDAEAARLAGLVMPEPRHTIDHAAWPELQRPRRHLRVLYPRGGERNCSWGEGAIPILPHD